MGGVSTATQAVKQRNPQKISSERVAVPSQSNITKPLRDVLELLAHPQITNKNPAYSKDKEYPDKSVVDAFNEALADGVIDRGEFEDIMEHYYGIGKVTESWWDAFTSKGENGKVNLAELAECLRFFKMFNTATRLSFEEMCGLDEVYVVGGGEIAGSLEGIGLSGMINPQAESIMEAAKALTRDDPTDDWSWFGTIAMTMLANRLKETYDFGDLDLKSSSIMRQMFGKYVIRWLKDNAEMTEEEWDALIDKQEVVKELEQKYGLGEIDLAVGLPEEQSKSEKILDEIIKLHQADPEDAVKSLGEKELKQLTKLYGDDHSKMVEMAIRKRIGKLRNPVVAENSNNPVFAVPR